jgi:hypothetical protein
VRALALYFSAQLHMHNPPHRSFHHLLLEDLPFVPRPHRSSHSVSELSGWHCCKVVWLALLHSHTYSFRTMPWCHDLAGKHVGRASVLPDGGLRLDLEWGPPLAGRGYDEFRWAAQGLRHHAGMLGVGVLMHLPVHGFASGVEPDKMNKHTRLTIGKPKDAC